MKKRFRTALLLLLVLLLAVTMAAPAFADGTITVSSVSGVRGELVDVQISLSGSDVRSGNFVLQYDSSVLELTETLTTTTFQCVANSGTTGSVFVSFASMNPIDTVLCTLTFRVTANTDSQSGTPVLVQQARLYDQNGSHVASNVIHGAVARKTVRLSMSASDTAEYQAVRAVVNLGGALSPAGGNFSISYDPTHFTVKSVLPLESMGSANYAYHIVRPGLVKISFSGQKAFAAGSLCAVVFQTIGSAGSSSSLTISEARMYDEDSASMDVSIVNGSLNIVVPSDEAPKLWCVGGAMQPDGTAKAAVVLQGRGYACGGNFLLRYDNRMKAVVTPSADCQINHDPNKGEIRVSWASSTAYSGEAELLSIVFSDAVQSSLTLEDVIVYLDKSTSIDVVDVRPGRINATDRVTAVLDEQSVSIKQQGERTSCTVTVDLADQNYFTDDSTDTAAAILALYQNGRMVGVALASSTCFRSGINEITLTAQANADVSEYRVFITDGTAAPFPLCQSISNPVPKN